MDKFLIGHPFQGAGIDAITLVETFSKLSKLAKKSSFDNLFVPLPDGKLHEPKGIHRQTTVI